MRLLRCILLFGVSLVVLAVVGIAALLLFLFFDQPNYDVAHPNYNYFAEMFERLREPVSFRGMTNEDVIDFSQLNGGEWKVACLLGGYRDPLETMRAIGANINEKDQVRWTKARSRGLRLAPVEEHEMAIVYVDLANNAQFIHFRDGIGPEGQGFQKCVARPETRLVLGIHPP
jgi:hypothetical protein